MQIGMIGLGKMGMNMAQRLIRGGHRVVGNARSEETIREAEAIGVVGAYSVEELVGSLSTPRVVWVMVPAGEVTESVINSLIPLLSRDDIIIDGGNSNYKDSVRRAAELADYGLHFVDAGTSGGIWGLSEGYSLMVGGEEQVVDFLQPIFETLAPASDQGWGRVGPAGAGHFTKMVHNGIEYGMMQSFAEGFEILKAKKEFALDLPQISRIWQRGSVVRSWLLDLIVNVMAEDPSLEDIEAYVADSGEGRWTVLEAIDLDLSAPVITAALQRRIRSRQEEPYSDKLVAAMRNQFGGHAVKKKED
ncbi:MAG: phosphogluconate dehydrogenase (NAD(+)-dependent, decarboxylating) [Anaerolineaceae bacterium]|nr:decarboxylating 6-phosphogluconate dehydrogenase [Anaerolineaceae bacterium]